MRKIAIITGYTCNNNCVFCYDAEKRHISDLGTKEVIAAMRRARDAGCDYLDLLGGEFTMRKDALRIIRRAKALGFSTIAVTTNGRMLSYLPFAKRVVEAGVNSVIFSVHGPDSKSHDALTQVPGSFDEMMCGIMNIKSLGLPFRANVTITRKNLKKLPAIGKLLLRLGCTDTEFIFADPTGGVNAHFEALMPGVRESAPHIKKVLEMGRKNKLPHWHVRYYPLCHINEYREFVSENSNVFDKVMHLGPEFSNNDVEGSRKMIGRTKGPQCRRCRADGSCEGIWTEYARRRGLGELKPVK